MKSHNDNRYYLDPDIKLHPELTIVHSLSFAYFYPDPHLRVAAVSGPPKLMAE